MNDAHLPADHLKRLEDVFARVPFARHLRMEFVSAERGTATFALDARDELMRMGGIMHGGALASLIDTAAAFAVLTTLGPDARTATVDMTIHFLRPVSGGRIEARARILREGRRLVILAVEATDEMGVLVATATATYVKQS